MTKDMTIIEHTPAYTETTEGIRIVVHPVYVDDESSAIERRFVFAYFVRIDNQGSGSVQLLRRHWFINHGGIRVEEVEGEGVAGKQPMIPPGKFHHYNSFCILDAMEGTMEGTYLMRRENGEFFRVTIPRFTLRARAN